MDVGLVSGAQMQVPIAGLVDDDGALDENGHAHGDRQQREEEQQQQARPIQAPARDQCQDS